ncbi:hypothetical protein BC629DRAFT_1266802, partial [Irpex lacteus]
LWFDLDVLNQLAPTQHGSRIPVRPDPRKSEAAARHLSKHVFPRQYGLPNAFENNGNGHTNHILKRRASLISELQALGSCKTPKRVKPALDLLDKLLWRHSKCKYKPLLKRLCPSKVR